MQKISISIDTKKITKDKLVESTYTNKEGVEVTQKKLFLEVIPLREKKFIKITKNGKSDMYKTHFVIERQSDAERDTKTPSNIVGDGITYIPKTDVTAPQSTSDSTDVPW